MAKIIINVKITQVFHSSQCKMWYTWAVKRRWPLELMVKRVLPPTSCAADWRWCLACCVSDFLHRLVKVAALHAGVTPVTYFTLGYILSGHLDEEITFSQNVSTAALACQVPSEQVFEPDVRKWLLKTQLHRARRSSADVWPSAIQCYWKMDRTEKKMK